MPQLGDFSDIDEEETTVLCNSLEVTASLHPESLKMLSKLLEMKFDSKIMTKAVGLIRRKVNRVPKIGDLFDRGQFKTFQQLKRYFGYQLSYSQYHQLRRNLFLESGLYLGKLLDEYDDKDFLSQEIPTASDTKSLELADVCAMMIKQQKAMRTNDLFPCVEIPAIKDIEGKSDQIETMTVPRLFGIEWHVTSVNGQTSDLPYRIELDLDCKVTVNLQPERKACLNPSGLEAQHGYYFEALMHFNARYVRNTIKDPFPCSYLSIDAFNRFIDEETMNENAVVLQLYQNEIKSLCTPSADKKARSHGLLLFGPPGTGKTSRVRKLRKMGFFQITGGEILSGPMFSGHLQGIGPHLVKHLFARKDVIPWMPHSLIVDELHQMCPSQNDEHKNPETNLALYNKWGGDSEVLPLYLFGCTNVVHMIDEAMLSRFGSGRAYIGPLTQKERAQILMDHLCSDAQEVQSFCNKTSLETVNFVARDFMAMVNEVNDHISSLVDAGLDYENDIKSLDFDPLTAIVNRHCQMVPIGSQAASDYYLYGSQFDPQQVTVASSMIGESGGKVVVSWDIDDKASDGKQQQRFRIASFDKLENNYGSSGDGAGGDGGDGADEKQFKPPSASEYLFSHMPRRRDGSTVDLVTAMTSFLLFHFHNTKSSPTLIKVINSDSFLNDKDGAKCDTDQQIKAYLKSVFDDACASVDSSLIIIDLDSICPVVRTVSDMAASRNSNNNLHAAPPASSVISIATDQNFNSSYRINKPEVFDFICRQFQSKQADKHNTIVVVCADSLLLTEFKRITNFPDTPTEIMKQERTMQEKEEQERERECVMCGQTYQEKDNTFNSCKRHPGPLDKQLLEDPAHNEYKRYLIRHVPELAIPNHLRPQLNYTPEKKTSQNPQPVNYANLDIPNLLSIPARRRNELISRRVRTTTRQNGELMDRWRFACCQESVLSSIRSAGGGNPTGCSTGYHYSEYPFGDANQTVDQGKNAHNLAQSLEQKQFGDKNEYAKTVIALGRLAVSYGHVEALHLLSLPLIGSEAMSVEECKQLLSDEKKSKRISRIEVLPCPCKWKVADESKKCLLLQTQVFNGNEGKENLTSRMKAIPDKCTIMPFFRHNRCPKTGCGPNGTLGGWCANIMPDGTPHCRHCWCHKQPNHNGPLVPCTETTHSCIVYEYVTLDFQPSQETAQYAGYGEASFRKCKGFNIWTGNSVPNRNHRRTFLKFDTAIEFLSRPNVHFATAILSMDAKLAASWGSDTSPHPVCVYVATELHDGSLSPLPRSPCAEVVISQVDQKYDWDVTVHIMKMLEQSNTALLVKNKDLNQSVESCKMFVNAVLVVTYSLYN